MYAAKQTSSKRLLKKIDDVTPMKFSVESIHKGRDFFLRKY